MPKAFVKHAAASPLIRASDPTTAAAETESWTSVRGNPLNAPRKINNSLTKPFKGGRPLMAAAATRKLIAGQGHSFQQAPQPVHVARARGVRRGSGPQEEQTLEDCVVQHVQEPAGKTQDRHHRCVVAHTEEPHAESQADDPDVFHAVVGEQLLDVVLGKREEHARQSQRPLPARRASNPTTPAARPGKSAPEGFRRFPS